MKSITYIAEITTQKNEKYISEEWNLPACSSAHFVSTKKFSVQVYQKSVLPFLTNQVGHFISQGMSHYYFSRNFLLSFLLWYDFKIQGGSKFLCLSSSVNNRIVCQQFFFNWKLNIVFHVLDLDKTILNLIKPKITKKHQNFHHFFKFPYFTPYMTWILV